MLKLQRQVDAMPSVRRWLVYLAMAAVAYLLLTLALILTNTPPFGKTGVFFVLLLAAGGNSGSQFRNRKHSPAQSVAQGHPKR